MGTNNIILQNVSSDELKELLKTVVKTELDGLKTELQTQATNDELLTREQTIEYLQIDPSTLHRYVKNGDVVCYGVGNRRYFKKSELLSRLTIKQQGK